MSPSARCEVSQAPQADAVLPDCSGCCLPEADGGQTGLLRTISSRDCGLRATKILVGSLESGNLPDHERRAVQALVETFEKLTAEQVSRVFDHPVAGFDTGRTTIEEPAASKQPPAKSNPIALARHFIGAPDIPALTLVLPASAFGSCGLYLPHLHAVLRSDKPLAVLSDGEQTRLTGTDGRSVTFLNGVRPPTGANQGFLLTRLYMLGDVPVLSGAPEIEEDCRDFETVHIPKLPQSLQAIAQGLNVLRDVWPLAWVDVRRQLRAILPLARRAYSRSHSPSNWSGTVLLTPEDPYRIADLLVHEVSHIRINLFREFDVLLAELHKDRTFESPWRSDPRPLSGLVLGIHAFLNLCQFYCRLIDAGDPAGSARKIFERQRRNVATAWKTAKPWIVPSPTGESLFKEIEREVQSL